MRSAFCLAMVVAAGVVTCGAVLADTVHLHGGGRADGVVDRIEIRVGGERKTLLVGDFARVTLREGLDQIRRVDDTELTCQVLSVQIKTVAGLLTFPRERLVKVRIVETQAAADRRAYIQKLAKLGDGDLAAIQELMVWCDERGMKAEAHDLARRILAAEPDPVTSLAAHKMLGHRLVDGEWVAPKPGVPPDSDPRDKPEPKSEPEPAKPSRPSAADSEIARRLDEMTATYRAKADDAKSSDYTKVRDAFEENWQKSRAALRQLKDRHDRLSKQYEKLQDREESEQRRINENRDNRYEYEKHRDQLEKVRKELDENQKQRERTERSIRKQRRTVLALAYKIKAAREQAARRARRRAQQVGTARLKIENLLRAGRKPTAREMEAIFEEALKLD
jgi:hypothetical protein